MTSSNQHRSGAFFLPPLSDHVSLPIPLATLRRLGQSCNALDGAFELVVVRDELAVDHGIGVAFLALAALSAVLADAATATCLALAAPSAMLADAATAAFFALAAPSAVLADAGTATFFAAEAMSAVLTDAAAATWLASAALSAVFTLRHVFLPPLPL